jgi:DNA-binding transcriptional LysR family regulator
MSKLPDFEALAIFAKVAELRSFSAAAGSLGLSKATVSKAVTRLEQSFEVQLFHRSTRSLSLTPSGQMLAAQAAAMLEQAQAIEELGHNESKAPHGLVRIAAPMGLGLSQVAPAIAELMEGCPELAIDLQLSDAKIDLVDEGIDIALRVAVLADSSLRARRLRAVRLKLVGAPAYFEKHGLPKNPDEIRETDCFGYSYAAQPAGIRLIGPAGEERMLRPRGRLTINSGEAMLAALCKGIGVAVLPDFIVDGEIESGRLLHVLPDWRGPDLALHLVTPPGRVRPNRVTTVIEFLTDRFTKSDG